MENCNKKIVTKPAFAQTRRSLMLDEWNLTNLRKLKEKWRERCLKACGARSCGRGSAGALQALFPAARLPETKDKSPAGASQENFS